MSAREFLDCGVLIECPVRVKKWSEKIGKYIIDEPISIEHIKRVEEMHNIKKWDFLNEPMVRIYYDIIGEWLVIEVKSDY